MTHGVIAFNADRLRGRMAEKGYTIKSLSSKIGVHANTMSNKLFSLSYFTTAEIVLICKALDISDEQIPYYFFMHQ